MKMTAGRRGVLKTLGLSLATSAIGITSSGAKPTAATVDSALMPPGATHLDALKARLAQAPRRRDFKTVPMITNRREQWDHEALMEVLSYQPAPRQAWDNTDIGGPWLNLMRNALNSQIWSFKHPDFLAVSVTHGTAQLALYDQAVEIVLRTRRPSISLVQRHLRIGYNRAARLIEDMERAGMVSAMQSNGNREVLVPASAE